MSFVPPFARLRAGFVYSAGIVLILREEESIN
jgi:hypothetical protein